MLQKYAYSIENRFPHFLRLCYYRYGCSICSLNKIGSFIKDYSDVCDLLAVQIN